jgi:hypothetical protein
MLTGPGRHAIEPKINQRPECLPSAAYETRAAKPRALRNRAEGGQLGGPASENASSSGSAPLPIRRTSELAADSARFTSAFSFRCPVGETTAASPKSVWRALAVTKRLAAAGSGGSVGVHGGPPATRRYGRRGRRHGVGGEPEDHRRPRACFILGMEIRHLPYVVAQWRREHPGEPIADGQAGQCRESR